MSKIIPKLNLNKTPQQVENNSLIFAKNVKLLSDGTIGPDVSLQEIDSNVINDTIKGYIGHVVGLDNIVYIFKQEPGEDAKIYKYSEDDNILEELHTGWKYNGGKIDGFVTTNNTNQIILTVCEYDAKNNINVPIKHINLSECSDNDDESLYTQAPNIPFTNLLFNGRYTCTIPNGVYQFFVRYKIREDFYTPWYPCSGEIYSGTSKEDVTIQGSLKYVDINYDSPQSFKFRVQHLFDIHTTHYTEYQIGFILSNNDGVIARSWKSFNFDVQHINFDYDKFSIKEINIDDLIKTNFEIFDVKNITYYRNKEYISNYKETDFNPNINVDDISVTLNTKFIDSKETISIGDKNLNQNKEIDGIDVFYKWGNSNVNVLLDNVEIININKITNEEEQNYTCKIGEADLLWNASDVSLYEEARDIYYIVGWNEKSTLNDKKHCGDFYSPSLASFLNYIEDDYIGVSWDGGKDYRIKVSDRGTNPIGNTPNMQYKWYWRGGSYNDEWNDYPGHGFSAFWSYPYIPPREISTVETYWKDTIKTNIQNYYGKTIIYKIENNNEVIWGSDLEKNGDGTNFKGASVIYNRTAIDTEIRNKALSLLKPSITGLGENGLFYINNIPLNNIKVYYVNIDFNDPTIITNEDTDSKISKTITYSAKVIPFISEYTINVKPANIKVENNQIESKTLMPYTGYDFYIHFVKQNGIATNGYKIGEGFYNGYTNGDDLQIIYPEIKFGDNFEFPEDYVSWFVSIYKAKNEVCRGFNHYIKDGYHYMDCIECDALLYNLTKNIHIYENNVHGVGDGDSTNDSVGFKQVSSDGEYFSSGNSTVLELFGNAGVIRWPVNGTEENITQFVELEHTLNLPITANDTIYIGASIYDDKEDIKNPIEISKYKAINLANIGNNNLIEHLDSKLTEFEQEFKDYSKYISHSIKFVPSDSYASLEDITGESFDEFISKATPNTFYAYEKNNENVITGIKELTEDDKEIIDLDNIKNDEQTLISLTDKLTFKRNEQLNIESSIIEREKLIENTKKAIIDSYAQYDNLVTNIQKSRIDRCDVLLKHATGEAQIAINKLRGNIENELNLNNGRRLFIDQQLAVIDNARLAASLSSADSDKFISKAGRTGAKEIIITNKVPSIGNTILNLCEQISEQGDENNTSSTNTEEGCLYDKTLSSITLASATIQQLADAVDATQLTLNNPISSNTKENSFANISGITAGDSDTVTSALNKIYSDDNEEGALALKYKDNVVNKITELENLFKDKNDDNTLNENSLNNKLTVLTAKLDTNKAEITDLETRISALRSKLEKVNNSNVSNGFVIKRKSGKFGYDKSKIFTVNDYIDKIVITLKSNLIDGLNPVRTLDCIYKETDTFKNTITNNIKTPIISNGFVNVANTKSKTNSITKTTNWLNYIKRNPTIAKTIDNSYWVVIPTNASSIENKELIKITPYLHNSVRSYSDHEQMNLPGFLCSVKKLNHIVNDVIYVNGTDVYDKQYDEDCIILNQINNYVHNSISGYFHLPSNYNLNCLSLRENLNVSLRNYIQEETKTDIDTGETEIIENTFIQTFKSVDSLVCSSIYQLKSMYKDYIRKIYNVKSTKPINIIFENTIRSSDTNTDEVYRNIYRFEAEDYYNVPANRGIITYLFTTLDTIFVHTKHALYKFSGKNTLSSLDGDINLKQNEVFDSGITTILDSINGFAGLTEKHHGLVTSKAYIFYDKQINTVFAFAEQGGIVNISEPINKLLTHHTPIDVKLISDEANDRFYICFSLKNGHHLTLTYNFKVASFVSIHDLSYICGFSTRTNTYLIYKDENTWTMYKSVPSIVTDDKTNYIQYNKCYSLSIATNLDNQKDDIRDGIAEASIDVLYNLNYESIKSLDWINWIVSKIIKFDEGNYVAEEDLDREYCGYKIRIYSDTCATELMETSNQQNDYRMYLRGTDGQYPSTVNPSAYLEGQEQIRHNNGIWSMNYFRNIKNRLDIHKYNENTPLANARHLYQEDSLIYGKYFVFRIIFTNDNFKFENITFNVKDYEKI